MPSRGPRVILHAEQKGICPVYCVHDLNDLHNSQAKRIDGVWHLANLYSAPRSIVDGNEIFFFQIKLLKCQQPKTNGKSLQKRDNHANYK